MDKKNLLSIGELSKISKLSIQTLRHYNKLEILIPEYIDEDSGYRYYSKSQILITNIIKELKTFQFSLNEIKEFIKRKNFDSIKNIYEKKIFEIDKKIKELTTSRNSIFQRYLAFKKSLHFSKMSADRFNEIITKDIPQRNIAFVEKNESFTSENLIFSINELQNLLYQKNLKTFGPFIILIDNACELGKKVQYKTAVQTSEVITENFNFFTKIPQGKYVTILNKGKKNSPRKSDEILLSWMKNNSYQKSGPIIYIYHVSLAHTTNPNEMISEIQIKVEKI